MTDMTPTEGRQPALPDGYPATLAELKRQVRTAQHRAQRTVNTELIRLYWTIGTTILERQAADGWGAKVIDRLTQDLRAEFPDMKGFSRSNVHYMRAFATAWPSEQFVQQPVLGTCST